MGMNKQFKVTFNVTATLSDSQEEAFMDSLMGLAKSGDRSKYFDSILVAALAYGPEGAMEQAVKQSLRATVREMAKEAVDDNADELGVKFSPARVEVIR